MWGRASVPKVLIAGILLVAAVGVLAPLIGSASIDLGRAFAGEWPDSEIFFQLRLPRVLLAMLVGGGLAVSGVIFQALVRDALADPYVLGVASGASLGAVMSICFQWTELFGLPATWVASSIGAATVLLLVLAIATQGKRMSSFTLLLAGVTINSMCAAMMLFLHNLSNFGESFVVMRWLMGGLDPVSYPVLGGLAALVLGLTALVYWRARDWNLLAVGEEWATTRGVPANRLMLVGFLAGSLITGAVTALTGPIAFIGLIVPHALRLVVGADHRVLLPASLFGGAAFLVICDTVSRTALAPVEIPVGVITAMLGGPFFIWLLRSKRRSLWL